MNQLKFYKIGLILMVILNVVIVGSIFFKTKKQHTPVAEKRMAFKHIKEVLKLDEAQFKSFRASATKHRKSINAIDKEKKMLLKPVFENFNGSSIVNDSILSKAANFQKQKIQLTLNHFEEVKNILREDQYAAYARFVKMASVKLLSLDQGQRPLEPPLRNREGKH